MGNSTAMLMRDHGCNVIEESVQLLVIATIYFRDSAEIQYRAITLVRPRYLSKEEARYATRIMCSDIATERA